VVDDAVQRSSPFWGEHGLAFLIEAEAGHVFLLTLGPHIVHPCPAETRLDLEVCL